MGAAPKALTIEANCDFLMEVTWYDSEDNQVQLNGYTAKCQIRDSPGGLLLLDFNVAPSTITIDPASDAALFYCPAATTSGLSWVRGYYDVLFIDPNSKVFRLLEGPAYIDKGISQ